MKGSVSLVFGIVSGCLVAVTGCASEPDEPGVVASAEQGIAELRVDAGALAELPLTRVAVEVDGRISELVFNPARDSFDGALAVPAGAHTVIARAFSGDALIGASNATSIEVEAGVVTRVLLSILDLRSETPRFGPIFDSLSFPTSTTVNASATFALSVVAPAHDPIAYRWTSSCADSMFGAPSSATTTWVKPTTGSCRIAVEAVSNDISVSREFDVVVFPEGSQDGGVAVSGAFLTAPRLFMTIGSGQNQCLGDSRFTADANASCLDAFAQPEVVAVNLSALSWGGGTPGTLSLSDDCGGKFAMSSRSSDFVSAFWLPPLEGGVCIVKATALNGEGGIGTLSLAALARPGVRATQPVPRIFGFNSTAGCFFENSDPNVPPSLCSGSAFVGGTASVSVSTSAADGLPVAFTVTDNCGGTPTEATSVTNLFRTWTLSQAPGSVCTVTVRAVSFQNVEAFAQSSFSVLGP